ncbi:MAG: hypothetical protein Q8S33_04470 [Myxococcales bacterium]|nr:hypothetical protein [Myxococcales bacterium]
MRTNVGLLLVLLVGCGREIVEELGAAPPSPSPPAQTGGGTAGGSVDAPLSPGWYDLPADTVEPHLGVLVVNPTDGRTLRTTLMLDSTAPAGDYTVAVAWRGATQLQVLGTTGRDSTQLDVRLAPPASVLQRDRCGARASGVVFVLRSDVLVGASTGGRFMDFTVEYDECGRGSTRGAYLDLQRDQRLEYARCLALSIGCADTSPVRVTRGLLRVSDMGIGLETSLGFVDANAPVVLEVNGVVAAERHFSLPLDLFRAGKNRITVRMGQHTPWEANVVLPLAALSPRVSAALRLGTPFSIAFDAAPWAMDYRVDLFPVDAPWTRANYPSFSSPTSPIEGTFDGFPDGRGGRVTGTLASVRLKATRKDGDFTLTQETHLEAPISP